MITIINKYKTKQLTGSYEVKIWQETKIYFFGILVKTALSEQIV